MSEGVRPSTAEDPRGDRGPSVLLRFRRAVWLAQGVAGPAVVVPKARVGGSRWPTSGFAVRQLRDLGTVRKAVVALGPIGRCVTVRLTTSRVVDPLMNAPLPASAIGTMNTITNAITNTTTMSRFIDSPFVAPSGQCSKLIPLGPEDSSKPYRQTQSGARPLT